MKIQFYDIYKIKTILSICITNIAFSKRDIENSLQLLPFQRGKHKLLWESKMDF